MRHLDNASRILGYGMCKDNVFHDTVEDNSNKGVTIVLNKNHIFKNIKIVKSLCGTFIIFHAKYQSRDFIYGGYYGHAGNCDETSFLELRHFLESFQRIKTQLTDPMCIITGDWNFITNPCDGSVNRHNPKRRTVGLFIDFLNRHSLHDMVCDPGLQDHTFHRSDSSSRLDRAYTNSPYRRSIFFKYSLIQTDHNATCSQIFLNKNMSKKKSPRFPDHMVTNLDFKQYILDHTYDFFIHETAGKKYDQTQTYYDTISPEIISLHKN